MKCLRISIAALLAVAASGGAIAQSTTHTPAANGAAESTLGASGDTAGATGLGATTLGAGGLRSGTSLVEVSGDALVNPFNLKAEAMQSREVYDSAGNAVGEIDDILGTTETTPTAVSIEFDGEGWFDADQTRIVDLSDLSLDNDRMVIGLDKARVLGLPARD